MSVVLIAAGWSAAIGVLGLAVGWLTRSRSFRWLLSLVAVVGVTSVVAGVVGTARAMFLSDHDFGVVLLVCVVAGLVAVGFAATVAAAVVRSSNMLREGARHFAESGAYAQKADGPSELREVAAELARTSARLFESREREQRLELSRRELVSWVSHDLRTPLAGLRAMTEALEDDVAEDPGRYYRQMRTEVDRMVRMVDDLFELSRIHAGVLQLNPEPMALRDVVSEALAGAEPVARAAKVRLGGTVEEMAMVCADPAGLTRVVANLVMNAIGHTPPEGEVTIEGRRFSYGGQDRVELSVRDQCGGIPVTDLRRVFDVAWRGTPARTPIQPGGGAGAGLGLAIVRGIVEAHHGQVTVHNQDPGCRFVVTLPAA
ncbi:MAG: Two-component system sensor histidine kinase [uncultured Nocardioidaceae bacterium]|uniref:histidine kinase n=1 Tax=uncultured Nocardioidaceae bacterium TaxID=253824 RepID=A0A6J4MN31_9ACTN|nr:MAG: Two-component system sensor histidine kinase [uncultured Nocardioidaceae bacterium]